MKYLYFAVLIASGRSVLSFVGPCRSLKGATVPNQHGNLVVIGPALAAVDIEFQSDASKYGRGEMHLSAAIDMGDVVVYQTGSWLVDGVLVGDGSEPEFRYGLVETIQLVWTHNCEHGVIRVLPLVLLEADGTENLVLSIEQEEECDEFGPEQLVAKLPIVWAQGAKCMPSPILLSDDVWKVEQGMWPRDS